jgi:hypothetical protein
MGPVSTPASGRNTVTPASFSPQGVAAAEAGQERGVEAQRALGRRVDDLLRQDDGDEGEQVQVRAEVAVLRDELRDRHPLAPEAAVTEQRQAALLRLCGERVRALARRRRVHPDDLVARLQQTHQRVAPEGGLSEEGDAQRHGVATAYRVFQRSPTRPCGFAG